MIVADLFARLGLQVESGSWAKGEQLVRGLGAALGVYFGVQAVRGLVEMVEGVGEAAVATGRLAQKLGMSTAKVQELGYAASVSGASAEDMQVSLQHLARGLDEARTKGAGPTADAFRSLGVSMDNPVVKSGDLAGVTELLADKFAALPDSAHKTAIAMDIFGRSGTSLIPTLDRGGAGIRALGDEFKKTGAEIGDSTIKSFEELEGTQKRLGATLKGIKTQIAVALLPALTDLANSVLAWVDANHEAINSGIQAAVTVLSYVFKGLGLAVEAVIEVFGFFEEHSDLAKAIIIALGVVIAAFAAEAAVAWLIAFWPVALVAAAIAAVILIVMDLWKSITTGKGKAADAFRWLKRVAKDWWESLKQIGSDIEDFFIGVGRSIKQAFGDAWDWIVKKAEEAGNKIINLPGIKQLIELGHKIGGAIGADTQADGAYDNAVTGGQFTGTEEEFNAQRAANMAGMVNAPDRGVGSAGGAAAPSSVTVGPTTINVTAPNADPKAVADQVQSVASDYWNRQMRDAHAATGGADQP